MQRGANPGPDYSISGVLIVSPPPKGDHLCSNARQPFQPSPSLPPFGLLPLLPGWLLRQMLRRFALIPRRKKKKGGDLRGAGSHGAILTLPKLILPPKKKPRLLFPSHHLLVEPVFGSPKFEASIFEPCRGIGRLPP